MCRENCSTHHTQRQTQHERRQAEPHGRGTTSQQQTKHKWRQVEPRRNEKAAAQGEFDKLVEKVGGKARGEDILKKVMYTICPHKGLVKGGCRGDVTE